MIMKDRAELVKKCYYIAVIVSLVIFALSIPLTHYVSLRLYLWKQGSSFYDFFFCIKNNIYWNRENAYELGGIYPPLANVLYMLITRCMSTDTLQQLGKLSNYNEIKALQECGFYFVLYMNVLLLLFYLVCTSLKKGSKLEKNVFTISMLFTVPFLYQFERANIIFLALSLTMIFFLWKDSENCILREVSFLSLAIASGIKVYPAIYGALLIKEKRYKEAGRLVIYGVVAFFAPFVCFGNVVDKLLKMVSNMQETAAQFTMTRAGCQLNYSIIINHLLSFTGNWTRVICGCLMFLIVCFGIFSIFQLKEKWKVILLMTCMLIGIPSFSYVYAGIFMVIPIIAFLDDRKNIKKIDFLYLVGMLLVILPLPFCWTEGSGEIYYSYMNISIPVLVEGTSILLMTILLIGEALYESFLKRKYRLAKGGMAFLLCVIAILLNWHKLSEPYDYINFLKKTLSEFTTLKEQEVLEQEFTASGSRLDRIVLKLRPASQGKLICKVVVTDSGDEVEQVELQMEEMEIGYNEINFNSCYLEKGKSYILELSATGQEEDSIIVYHSENGIKETEEYARMNGESTNWYLGVQIYEYS